MRALVILALPAAACAAQLEVLTLANWHRLPVGERGMFEGGAIIARVDGPNAGYANPAGLADLAHSSISGTVTAIEYTRVGTRTAGGTASSDEVQLKPNLVGFASDLPGDHGGWAFVLANPISWSSSVEVRSEAAEGSRNDDGRSSLSATVIGLAWGGRLLGAAVGVALEGWLLDYRYDAGATAQDATTLLTATYSESGRQLDLRLGVGMQHAHGDLRLGLMLRSPGWRLTDQGSIAASTNTGDGNSTVLTSVRATGVGFHIPLPWSMEFGLAWLPPAVPGLEIEAVLAAHGGSSSITVLGAALGTTTTIANGSTTVDPFAVAARTVNLRPTFNPRLGLRYRFPGTVFDHAVALHAGGWLDRSPVAESEVFAPLDLVGASFGISVEKGPMLTTAGATVVTSGTLSDTIGYVSSPGTGLRPDLENTDATFAVRTLVIGVATAYRF